MSGSVHFNFLKDRPSVSSLSVAPARTPWHREPSALHKPGCAFGVEGAPPGNDRAPPLPAVPPVKPLPALWIKGCLCGREEGSSLFFSSRDPYLVWHRLCGQTFLG